MLSILTALLGFADPIAKISQAISQAKIAATNATTDQARIEAEAEAKALEIRRDVLVAEAPGSRVNQFIRVVLSIPAIVIIWKIVIWDLCLGWGSTNNPSQFIWSYILAVVGFYLLNRTIQVARR